MVYVSPLEGAVENDIQRNLELPLAGIAAELQAMGLDLCTDPGTGAQLGDTPAG